MTNYQVGISPASRIGHMLQSCSFVDDFMSLSASATDDNQTWDNTSITGTLAAAETESCGAVVLASGGSSLAEASMQLNGEPIVWDNSRDFIFEIQVQLTAITGATWFFGLSEKDSSGAVIVGTSSTVGHIGFKAEDASIDYTSRAVGAAAESQGDTTSDFVAATNVVLSMKWAAQAQKMYFYVDGVKKKTLTRASDNLPVQGDDFTILLSGDTNTTGASVSATVNYVVYIQDRY